MPGKSDRTYYGREERESRREEAPPNGGVHVGERYATAVGKALGEAKYRSLFDNIDQGFCIMEILFDDNGRGIDHRFLETNPAFERHTGLVDAVGKTARQLVPDLEPEWPERYGRVVKSGQPDRFTMGSEAMGRWFEVDAFPIGEPGQHLVGLLFADITDRKRAERALEANTRRFKVLAALAEKLFAVEAPADAASAAFEIMAQELDLHAYFNFMPEDETTLRLDSYSGIPSHAAHLIQHLEVGQAVCGLVAQRREPIHVTDVQQTDNERVDLIRKFGLRAYFCNPLLVGAEFLGTLSFGTRSRDAFTEEEMDLLTSAVRYVALANDRMRSQKELRQAKEIAEEASRAKSEFLANMSHEIRTPMTVFMAAIEHLLLTDPDPDRRHLLRMADAAGKRLRALIDDILDFSRIEARRVVIDQKPFDLRQCVHEAVEMLALAAREKNLKLRIDVAAKTPERVVGDPNRVSQVLINLIGNAVKFTHQGEVRIDVRSRGPFLEFSVADTGIGIPEEKRHLLFQSFSQVDMSFHRQHGGSGLGLAISKGLVELMGGDICVQSRVGQGSVFTFAIPLPTVANPSPAPPETLSLKAGGQHAGARVLLVDDEPMIREMLAMMLQRRGLRTETAETGKDALRKWEEGNFDLILMDLQMPEMNGIEATRAIRDKEKETKRRTCIVGLTAHVRREIQEDCLASGMDRVLVKPVQMKDLFSLVDACLSG